MNIHEYQAKELLRRFGVLTDEGRIAADSNEARALAKQWGGKAVLKAQIHAGGRGKGGGIRLASTAEEAADLFDQLLGMKLVTHQTGAKGQTVRKVYVANTVDIERELYLSILVDRGTSRVTLLASQEGGMEIEDLAAHHPEKIHKIVVDPAMGFQPYQARRVAYALGLDGAMFGKATQFAQQLYRLFRDLDCTLVEINPLVVNRQGDVLALDCKMTFDDSALFRHPDIEALRDLEEEAPAEIEASKYHLNFVKLDGNIGCMVNGAGLAMATMDIIQLHGGRPANFLDVGGSATEEAISHAFRIILQDVAVQAILVNIFGGIMRCDIVAKGIVGATRELDLQVPVVVRLEGTHVEEGRRILAESGLNLIPASDLQDAAVRVLAAIA